MGSCFDAVKRLSFVACLCLVAGQGLATDDKVAAQGDSAASENPPPPVAKRVDIVPIAPIGDEAQKDSEPKSDAPDCDPEVLHVKGAFGSARFTVQVADTPESRAQGLMHVEKMAMSHGMLFVYPSQRPVAFWMKNTLIPLDMIFADQNGVVVDVHMNAIPGDLTSIPSAKPAQYVLEINGGLSGLLNIQPGALLSHPSIVDANWPCR